MRNSVPVEPHKRCGPPANQSGQGSNGIHLSVMFQVTSETSSTCPRLQKRLSGSFILVRLMVDLESIPEPLEAGIHLM